MSHKFVHRRVALILSAMLMVSAVSAADWQEGSSYAAGATVDYNGKTYSALITHTAYAGANWNPASTPTLWKEISTSATTPPKPSATPPQPCPIPTPPGPGAVWVGGDPANGICTGGWVITSTPTPTPPRTTCPELTTPPQPTLQLKYPARWELVTTKDTSNCLINQWQPTCGTNAFYVDGECRVPLPVVTTTVTPQITSSPASNNWNAATVYTAGQRVSYNGAVYEAKWWTQGETPTNSEWGPWKRLGVAQTPLPPTPSPSPIGSCISPGFTPECTPTPPPANKAPNVTLQTYASVSYQAPFVLKADASDADGSVAKVDFYINGKLVGSDSSAPYEITARNDFAIGSTVSIYAIASDNLGASTQSSSKTVAVFSDIALTPQPTVSPTPTASPTPTPTASPTPTPTVTPCATVIGNGGCNSKLPKHALIGYWHNFTNPSGDTYRIRDVAPEWDVIMISFADDAGNGAVAFNLDKNAGTEAEFIADVAAKRAQGKKVILSLGGQEGRMTLSSKENVTNFVNSLHAIITKYGFDGIDLDLESGAGVVLGTPIINNLIDAVKQLKAKVGPSFYLSMAPEHPYVQGGYVAYSGIWGAYLPIIDGLRDDLNMIHVQYYNNGGLWTPYSNGALNEGTVDGLVGGSLMLIEGFKTVGGTGWEFKGLRPDQVAFGVPSGRSSANTGFVTNQVVTDALTCLTQLKNCGMVKPKQAYPDYRGVMTWSINWDKKDGYNFSKPTSATLKALPK
jgi:chitinase